MLNLRFGGENGIFNVGVVSEHIKRNTGSEGDSLDLSDAEVRKHREQIGFDTLVVYAVNDEY